MEMETKHQKMSGVCSISAFSSAEVVSILVLSEGLLFEEDSCKLNVGIMLEANSQKFQKFTDFHVKAKEVCYFILNLNLSTLEAGALKPCL